MYPKDKFLSRLNYEQFVACPEALVDQLAAAGFAARPPQKAAASAEPPSWHTVAGNPNRFNKGTLVLEVDDEWTRQMSAGSFLKVTAMTFPLLMRYGYSLRRKATPGSPSLHG